MGATPEQVLENHLANAVAAEIVDELTPEEERDRLLLETKVDRGSYQAWAALRELRVRKLYRPQTWDKYCKSRFSFGDDTADLKIFAAEVVDELEKIPTICREIMPTKESQVRSLRCLSPNKYAQAWLLSVEEAGHRVPSGRIVKGVVDRIKERAPAPNPHYKGEVCFVIAKDNPELKGLSGCWGIVLEVYNHSCCVRTWNGDKSAVKPENLKSLDYTDIERACAQRICDRITRLRTCDRLESAAIGVLEGLGRLKRAQLTSLEEKMLKLLEEEYL